MADKKGLGRGLDALLGGYEEQEKGAAGVLELSVYDLDTNPDQPRKTFDEDKLKELAASLKQHGVVQPLIVKKNGARYTIIAGERRFRAARMAGLATVPVIVSDADPVAMQEIALIENIQRENLNPIEEALAIRFLMKQHDLTQEELSSRIGKSRPVIANALRLLTLPESVRDRIADGAVSAGHGKMLAGMDDKDAQQRFAVSIENDGWSVRRLEEEIRQLAEKKEKKPRTKRQRDPELDRVETELKTALGAKVQVSGSQTRGKVVISYYSRDDLENIFRSIAEK